MLGVTWTVSPPIKNLLDEISALNLIFQKYHPHPESLAALRRQSIFKSAVYSARIENIAARIEDPIVQKKVEIRNLISAYNFIFSSSSPRHLSINLIRHFHRFVLRDLSPDAGHWRSEPWAIFNQAGVAVYLAPVHFELPRLMPEYVSFTRSLREFPPLTAAIAQFALEKIHPFADGNGRVGRLVSTHILEKSGFGRLSEVEEYIDTHRSAYYSVLEPNQNCTDFIEFILTAQVRSAQIRLEKLKETSADKSEISQLPRRREILAIIRDHPQCSFDFLSRRFAGIKPNTLHYDLQQLQKTGLVIKHGISRGAVYSSASF